MACILATVCLTSVVRAQDETIKIRSDVVLVPVTVMDRVGKRLTDLEKRYFHLLENDSEQDIEVFQPVEMPVSVLMLIDVSGSLFMDLDKLALAANEFVRTLRPTDSIRVVFFAERIHTVQDWISVKDFRAKDPVRLRLQPARTKRVYDALRNASKTIGQRSGRKAVVILSDGIQEDAENKARSFLREVPESDAQIYTLAFDTNPRERLKNEPSWFFEKRNRNAEFAARSLEKISELSGGRNLKIEEMNDLRPAFREIVAELGQQYLLGYSPKDPPRSGDRRSIRVRVDVPNAVVRSRTEVVFK